MQACALWCSWRRPNRDDQRDRAAVHAAYHSGDPVYVPGLAEYELLRGRSAKESTRHWTTRSGAGRSVVVHWDVFRRGGLSLFLKQTTRVEGEISL